MIYAEKSYLHHPALSNSLEFMQQCVSLNNGYVEGSFISLLEPVGAPADPKSVVRNLVAPRIL